jgi:thiamine transport system substrate-binding protein
MSFFPTPYLTAAAIVAVTLTACGGDASRTPGDGAATDAGAAATPAEPSVDTAEPVTVTLLTHDSFNISEDVLRDFQDETGITVELLAGGDAGQTVNQAILTAGDPQADVLFGVDNTFLSRALEADVFLPYQSPALSEVPERYILDDEHRVTPVDFGDVCLNYDRAYYNDLGTPPPSDLDDLTDPDYAGQLVVENPATSSPGLAFLLATVQRFGEDGYLEFWSALRDNGVSVAQGWEDAYYGQFSGGAGEGDLPLVVSYASSPPAEVYFADPQPDESPIGVIAESCFRQIEFAGILRGTEHERAAQRVIDWMLSLDFQEDIPLSMFVFPVRPDATLPEVFTEHTTVPEQPFEMDPQRITDNREPWIEDWTRTVLR